MTNNMSTEDILKALFKQLEASTRPANQAPSPAPAPAPPRG